MSDASVVHKDIQHCPDSAAIVELFKTETTFTLLSHTSPDPDAYGSSAGLALALQEQGKTVHLCNIDGVKDGLKFIPGLDQLSSELPASREGVLVVLDCGDSKRVGDAWVPELSTFSTVVNIDHHNSNELFGTFNMVLTEKSSTCEIVCDLLNALELPISKSVATSLMTGLMSDTGRFRYMSTTQHTFEVAASLVQAGAVPHEIAEALYGVRPLATVRLESLAFSSLELLGKGRIALLIVTPEMYEKVGASSIGTEGFVERARDIEGVSVAAFVRFDTETNYWKVSLRSTSPDMDVSKIARDFGGGGHILAAAFRWFEGLPQLKARLSYALTQMLPRQ